MPREDFDTYHAGAAGPPQGWAGTPTGSGTNTYLQDVQGGQVRLATGTTIDSEALLYLDNNIVVPGDEGGFEIGIVSLSNVSSVCVRAGLMTRADWAAQAAAGAIPALSTYTDYFIVEFDTSSSLSAVNWVLRYNNGGTEQKINTGIAAATSTAFKFSAMVDSADIPLVIANGRGVRDQIIASTGVTTALLAPGMIISNRAAADKQMTVDFISWGSGRV